MMSSPAPSLYAIKEKGSNNASQNIVLDMTIGNECAKHNPVISKK
jgi:hypothetical protein